MEVTTFKLVFHAEFLHALESGLWYTHTIPFVTISKLDVATNSRRSELPGNLERKIRISDFKNLVHRFVAGY
jgi:hypothetical protein